MSLFGMMRTSVSGMQAQASRLATVADNIANSDTSGYKRFYTEFAQLVAPGVSSGSSNIGSGGVLTELRQAVTEQGTLSYTSSVTDLAVNGSGFFIVQDQSGTAHMTRSGSFVPDNQGRLVNSAGMALMGYSTENGPVSAVANGFAGLQEVSIVENDLVANPSTQGQFEANLPSAAPISAAPLPSANAAGSEFGHKSSLVVYDNLGEAKLVDIYFTKTAADEWEVTVYDQADASPGTGFPYANAALDTQTLSFDLTNGNLTAGSTNSISFTIPNGSATTIDLSGMTHLAAEYTVFDAKVDGNSPLPIEGVSISEQGVLSARYADGSFRDLYHIPLATVTSPDNLTARTGSVFAQSEASGDVQIGFAGNGDNGIIVSSAVEQSNVDLAEELTTMIQSQRGYTANSKVFQTSSDLLDVLVNLKR